MYLAAAGIFVIFVFITMFIVPILCGYYRLPEETRGKVDGLKVFAGSILALPILFLAQILSSLIFTRTIDYWTEILFYFTYFSALILYIYTFFSFDEKKSILGENFFVKKKIPRNIVLGLCSYIALIPLYLFVQVIFNFIFKYFEFEVTETQIALVKLKNAYMHESPFIFVSLVLIVTVIVPIIEEVIFRGFLQSWIKQYWGRMWAIVFTSVIFSALHLTFNQPLLNSLLFCELFVVAFFLGFVFERQKSLLSSIVLHAFYNTLITFIYLTTSYNPA